MPHNCSSRTQSSSIPVRITFKEQFKRHQFNYSNREFHSEQSIPAEQLMIKTEKRKISKINMLILLHITEFSPIKKLKLINKLTSKKAN